MSISLSVPFSISRPFRLRQTAAGRLDHPTCLTKSRFKHGTWLKQSVVADRTETCVQSSPVCGCSTHDLLESAGLTLIQMVGRYRKGLVREHGPPIAKDKPSMIFGNSCPHQMLIGFPTSDVNNIEYAQEGLAKANYRSLLIHKRHRRTALNQQLHSLLEDRRCSGSLANLMVQCSAVC